MRVGDLRAFDDEQKLISVTAATTVQAAAKTMADAHVGAVVVMESGKLDGIFTERDLMSKVVAGGMDPATTSVGEVMTRDVKTAKVDDAAIDCMERMSDGKFRHMPVTDASGRPIGMLSQRDFVAFTLPQALSLATQSAKATVSKRYQPFAIVLSVIAYTVVLVAVISFF